MQRLLIWGLTGPLIALNLWVLSQVYRYFEHLITLVVTAAILAFLLNYPVRALQRVRLKRIMALAIVLLITAALLIILGVTLVPLLVEQITQLLTKIPAWLEASQKNLQAWDTWAKGYNLPLNLQGASTRLSSQIEGQLQEIASQALGVALGTLGGLVDSILVLVLAAYMLLDGDRLWQGLLSLLPPRYGVPLGESLRRNFQNFFISQLILALVMMVALIPVFLWLRVPFALLFALLIGIAEPIPLIGAALGIGIVSLLVMLQDFWLGMWVAIASTVLQQIRDNILAPRMMGSFTGLNPVWVLIAILIGLQIGGLLGALVAVPIAGTIKDMLDAVLERYERDTM